MLNKSIIQGRLTSDVELKQTPSGKSVCSFAVATERNYSSENERIVDFIPCVAWGKTAEFICKYFPKGSKIIIEGFISSRKYTDKEGKNRTAIEVVTERAYFDGDKKQESEEKPQIEQKQEPEFEEINPEDELPF